MRKALTVLSLCLAALYLRGINGDFILDDRTFFIENDVLSNLKPWNMKAILSGSSNYWGDLLPVRDFLYVLEFNLFGLNTVGYHLVSICLYVLVCISVHAFLCRFYHDISAGDSLLLSFPGLTRELRKPLTVSNFPALRTTSISVFLVTLIFAAYPVHVEGVAYIAGQKDLLSALFSAVVMNAFYVYFNFRDRKKIFLTAGIFFYYLALLSKPSAIMLSAFVPVLFFLSDRQKRRGSLAALALWAVVQIPAFWWILLSIRVRGQYWNSTAALITLPFGERLVVALKVLGAQTLLALRPFRLSFGYPFRISTEIDSYLIAGSLVLAAIIILFLRFRRDRVIMVAICLYICSILPVLQLQGPLGNEFVYDRYLFIPVLSMAILFERSLRSFTLARNRPIAYLAVSLILVTAFTVITFSYIPAFRNDIAVTKNSYEKFPGWSGSSFNYVYSLIEGGRLEEAHALTLTDKALSSPPWVRGYFKGWISLERGMAEQAIPELRVSLYLALSGGYFPYPGIPLARAYILAGRDMEAAQTLRETLKSPIYQPLEIYRARKLLEKIQLKQNT